MPLAVRRANTFANHDDVGGVCQSCRGTSDAERAGRRKTGVVTMASGAARAGLNADDLIALTGALAQGARATVYLRDPVPSLGLTAGTSAKVVSVDGATVLVRPRGVDDELPFEAEELSLTRNAAPKPQPKAQVKPPAAPPQPNPAPAKPNPAPAKPNPAPAKPNGAQLNGAAPPNATPPKAKSPRVAAGRRKTPTTVTVTLHADLDGAWTVAVQQGDRPAGKTVSVNADAVERAVAELGEPGAQRAVQAALDVAREIAAARIEELTRQLEQARGTLAALGETEPRNRRTRSERSS
jgi:hypothetical protein